MKNQPKERHYCDVCGELIDETLDDHFVTGEFDYCPNCNPFAE